MSPPSIAARVRTCALALALFVGCSTRLDVGVGLPHEPRLDPQVDADSHETAGRSVRIHTLSKGVYVSGLAVVADSLYLYTGYENRAQLHRCNKFNCDDMTLLFDHAQSFPKYMEWASERLSFEETVRQHSSLRLARQEVEDAQRLFTCSVPDCADIVHVLQGLPASEGIARFGSDGLFWTIEQDQALYGCESPVCARPRMLWAEGVARDLAISSGTLFWSDGSRLYSMSVRQAEAAQVLLDGRGAALELQDTTFTIVKFATDGDQLYLALRPTCPERCSTQIVRWDLSDVKARSPVRGLAMLGEPHQQMSVIDDSEVEGLHLLQGELVWLERAERSLERRLKSCRVEDCAASQRDLGLALPTLGESNVVSDGEYLYWAMNDEEHWRERVAIKKAKRLVPPTP